MDYCLLQFDALNFFLEVRLHGESLLNFDLFNVNPQIRQGNRKVQQILVVRMKKVFISSTPLNFKRKIFLVENSPG